MPIFAINNEDNDNSPITTTTMTNKRENLCNSLIFRRLLPPPISSDNVNNNSCRGSSTPALSPRSLTSRGRVFLLFLTVVTALFSSCEKEPLTDATPPGATRSQEPADTTGTPSLGMTITINPEWDGEQSYSY